MVLLTISQMAKALGVSTPTLRRWDRAGTLQPHSRTLGGHRRYAEPGITQTEGVTVCYARVSTSEQRSDLERQQARLAAYAEQQGWENIELIADIGSGLNCRKKGLLRLIDLLLKRKVKRLVIEHKDRLMRFAADLVFRICQSLGVEVTVTKQEDTSFENDLARDVLAIITVFSARLYGSRSHGRKHAAEAC